MRRLVVPVLICLALAGCARDDSDEPDSSPAPGAASSPAEAGDPSSEPSDSASSEPSDELATVIADAVRVTPPLEGYFFQSGHATTLDEAVAALAELELDLSPGNEVGSYLYDEADEDFKLCIQGPTGAFATYDTSPMSLFETGETGGCPA